MATPPPLAAPKPSSGNPAGHPLATPGPSADSPPARPPPQVEDGYSGPRMDGDDSSGYTLSLPFVEAMLREFKEQRLIHKRFAFEIVIQVGGLPPLADS